MHSKVKENWHLESIERLWLPASRVTHSELLEIIAVLASEIIELKQHIKAGES